MKNRLILVEGIPGSGKTTTAKKIKAYFESKGIKVMLFNEGDGHPADLAWNAYIPIDEYRELLKRYPEYTKVIETNTQLEDEYALVAYIKLGFYPGENELMKYFEKHEVCDGRIELDIFKKLHFDRWKKFANSIDDESVVIFECAYLQNHINELMGANNKDVEFIVEYMIELIKTVNNLKPKLIYLTQPNVFETIERVAKQRISSDKSKWQDWIDLVINYVENSKYGQSHNLKGFSGVIEFYEARKKIELAVIDKLDIDKSIINNLQYDWDKVYEQVISLLEIRN